MKLSLLAFQILFYPGSHVPQEKYSPFLNRLNQKLGNNNNIKLVKCFAKERDFQNTTEPTILMGHSIGGVLAILDTIKYQNNVSGLVLLNSHFNERWKMPYPGTSLQEVYSTPVLTMLGGKDYRLPLHKAIDDLFMKVQNKHRNHYFVVNHDLGHFSGLVNPTTLEETDKVVDPVVTFLKSVQTANMSLIESVTAPTAKRFQTNIEGLSQDSIILSNSCGVIDAILQLVLPRFVWNTLHWWYFLTAKPDKYCTYMYEDTHHVYWKGRPQDADNITKMLSWWTRSHNNTISEIKLPSLHPMILLYLTLPLFLRGRHHNTVDMPVLSIPINSNTTYYKIPHPHRLFSLLVKNDPHMIDQVQL